VREPTSAAFVTWSVPVEAGSLVSPAAGVDEVLPTITAH